MSNSFSLFIYIYTVLTAGKIPITDHLYSSVQVKLPISAGEIHG